MQAARRHESLGRLIVQPVLALELLGDGGAQFGNAFDAAVFGLAPLDGRDGRVLDIVGRVEVRLTGPQTDHIAARRLQIARLLRHRDGGRGLDAAQGLGEEIFGNGMTNLRKITPSPYQPQAHRARAGFVIPAMSTF